MKRTQKLKINTTVSLLSRIITIISGLILPRLILLYYGSRINGLVSSIGQFLGIITFLDLGVGSVVRAALYRPIAEKDNKTISSIIVEAKKYFQRIAKVLVLYVILLIVLYPLLIDANYGYFSTVFLIFSMSIGHFGQYYFGIVKELLLSANQQDYIQIGSDIVVTIMNLVVSVLLIRQGATIEFVKLWSGLVYLIRPLFLSYYVNKNFDINYDIDVENNPLPQKWSGMGQHIANTIQNSTSIVVITLFSTLENVSIYAVYNMVISAIKLLISSLTSGILSFFGDLFAKDEINMLNNYFNKIEWLIHTGSVFLYGMTAVLLNSFVRIYTTGVEDISYSAPIFSFLLVLTGAVYSIRIPYQSMIFSAGHFKQTQMSSYIEAGLNIILSVSLVNRFGLVGVAVGTLVAIVYRTLYLVVYLSRKIVFRPLNIFAKHIFVDFLSLGAITRVGSIIMNIYQIETLVNWVIVAIVLGIISLVIIYIINVIFYKETMITTIKSTFKRN